MEVVHCINDAMDTAYYLDLSHQFLCHKEKTLLPAKFSLFVFIFHVEIQTGFDSGRNIARL